MSNTEISRILRDLASGMERRPPESVAPVETPSTSAPTLARHPVDGNMHGKNVSITRCSPAHLGTTDNAEIYLARVFSYGVMLACEHISWES